MGRGLFIFFVIFGAARVWAQDPPTALAFESPTAKRKPITINIDALTAIDREKVIQAATTSQVLPKEVTGRIEALDAVSNHSMVKLPSRVDVPQGHGEEPKEAVPQAYEPRHAGLAQGIPKDMHDHTKEEYSQLGHLNHYYVVNPDSTVKAVIVTNDHGAHGVRAVIPMK